MMKRPHTFFTVLLLVILCAAASGYAQNPFLSDGPEEAEEKEGKTSVRVTLRYPAFVRSFMQRVFELQRTLNRRMTGLGRDIAGGRRPGALLLLALVCLVYGVVHALGPGHGKTVSFSYCLTERRSVLRGMLFGVFVAFAQVLVAIILIFVLQYLLRTVFYSSFESFRRVMRLVSAGLLAAIGTWLFLGSFGLVPSFHREPGSKPGVSSSGAMLPAALAIGMVPCPGAVIIMLFTMQMGIVHLGVLLALVFALGMSLTLSAVGLVTVSAGNLLARRLRAEKAAGLFHAWTGRLGGILLVIVGALVILSSG